MFVITLNKTVYEYDIHSIVKAFYPEKNIKVITPDTDPAKAADLLSETDALQGSIAFLDTFVNLRLEEKEYIWEWEKEQHEAFSHDYKDAFKGFLYKSLCTHTGKLLPWGNMTGIRPTKIAMSMLTEGKSHEEILNYYKEKHYVSDEKALLSIDIAERERKLLSPLHYEDGYSLKFLRGFCLP